jgi:hypothetical protein
MAKVLACAMCDAHTQEWVVWANWRGAVVSFCANDCLARWLARNLDEAAWMAAERDDEAPQRTQEGRP